MWCAGNHVMYKASSEVGSRPRGGVPLVVTTRKLDTLRSGP
jgi:hypothetical protein